MRLEGAGNLMEQLNVGLVGGSRKEAGRAGTARREGSVPKEGAGNLLVGGSRRQAGRGGSGSTPVLGKLRWYLRQRWRPTYHFSNDGWY